MDTLPLELLDLIVEHLFAGGGTGRPRQNSALHSCSLVSSKFRAPCQKLFYKSIALTSRPEGGGGVFGPYTFVEALAHFDASPHLVPYVSALDLSLAGDDATDPEDRAWLKNDVAFVVLSKFTNVSSCEFVNEGSGWRWERVPEEVPSAFLAWLALPLVRRTLRRVLSDGFRDFPMALLQALLSTASEIALQAINLQVPVASESTPALPPNRANTRDLESLTLTRCFPTSLDLLRSPRLFPLLDKLRSIRLHGNSLALPALCEAAANTLEHITLDYDHFESFVYSKPPTLPRLAHFIVQFTIHSHDESPDRTLLYVSQIQAILSSAPALLEFALQSQTEGYLSFPHEEPSCACSFIGDRMRILDATFAEHPTLEIARFDLDRDMGDLEEHRTAFKNSIREAFPKTLEKGRLGISGD
ncbi:hypothetical protein HMN09_00931200 [Mycena chlorophos]|uniref:F-box domain-containing protein n=1 Tax=Mycena chlorophos TaxID=658473 RepID=A0A8H6SIT0_MYCCL|nr:hypothetical protein HMN09_00931200 [Mycena chlorophos]